MVAAAVGASAVAGLAGSAMSAGAAGKAADAQAGAARQAAELQHEQYLQTRSDLMPYQQAGQTVLGPLSTQYQKTQDALTSAYNQAQAAIPANVNSDDLLQGPGGAAYRFNLEQGMKAVQNSAAARGLGVSGTALKQAGTYATGLANNYYQNYFNNAQSIFGDRSQQFANANTGAGTVFNQLYTPAALGENAAAQTGVTGANLATAAGNQLAAAGQAQAAGISAQANAISSGLNSVGNAGMNYLMLSKLNSSGGSSGGVNGPQTDPANG